MDANNTAILLIGFQDAYFSPNGALRSFLEESAHVDQVLANTLTLIDAVTPTTIPILHTPFILDPGYRDHASPAGILHAIKDAGVLNRGSRGAQTIPEIQAYGHRITNVPGKTGFNSFVNTNLDTLLRIAGISNLLIAGMITSLCVDSTGRSAYERGYHVTILSDCTASRTPVEQDFFCHTIFPLYGDALDHKDILEALG